MADHGTQRILIVAGEASGDLLGAHLAKALLARQPTIKLIGMGGAQMHAAGVEILIDADKLAVVGVWEVLKHLGDILSAMRTLKKLFNTNPPDLVIFIDYPGLNLRMAKHAKRAGIKVLYYVSPQIWAWRYGRIKKIKRYVDRMAVLLARISFVDLLEVPEAKSFFSINATFIPLEAASKAIPVPVIPPPIISKSNSVVCKSLVIFSLLKYEKLFIF